MRKQDIIRVVADSTRMTERQAAAAVNATVSAIQEALAAGDKVMISGFGSFLVVDRAPRSVRNPLNGVRMRIGPRRCAAFRAGVRLKMAVNHPERRRPASPDKPVRVLSPECPD